MKNKSLQDSIKDRRTYYQLSSKSLISDEEIQKIIEHVAYWAPSPFNSQSARMVLLLGDNHKKLWELTKTELKKVSKSEEAFKSTEEKVNGSFLSGYGTILFFEDQTVVKALQEKFPSYTEKFTQWSEHSSAIVQILTWMALENEGFGASLQHYNPLIDEGIQKEWGISKDWTLIAQMPFGMPAGEPGEKTHEPLEKRVLVFK
ncbi:MAG: nitroreductase family protein [Bacteroidia bacterium]|nr:nitroreductase family protein [Bacteroidia bacterium]